MKFKAILFDLDNTLLDFLTFKRETAKTAAKEMRKYGLNDTEENIYKKIFETYDLYGVEYNKTFYQVIKQYNLEINKAERIQQAAIVAYLKRKFEILKPYPEVIETLRKLKENYKLGVVSDAPRNKAWMRLVLSGLDDLFDVIVTFDDTNEHKPSNFPFKKALEELKLEPNEVLFVGDNPGRDIKGANALGMKTCLAKYGLWDRSSDFKADYEIEKFEDLLKVV
ncbi:MAG: HAD-IA family hydrolase [Candidatus Micrarchaeia archaeon]